jgi:hypothetical protein
MFDLQHHTYLRVAVFGSVLCKLDYLEQSTTFTFTHIKIQLRARTITTILTYFQAHWCLYLPPSLKIRKSSFCIYLFRMILKLNSDYFLKQRQPVNESNRDERCFLCGKDRILKYFDSKLCLQRVKIYISNKVFIRLLLFNGS